jgi:hypothetical protein
MAYNFTTASSQFLSTPTAVVAGSPVTIACWYNRKNTSTNNALVSVNSTTATNFNTILIGSTNLLSIVSNNGTTVASATYSDTSSNTWNHGCGVVSNNSSRQAFFNGLSGGTNTTTVNLGSQNVTTIGGRYLGAGVIGQLADALIAEVGIWNVALTAAEVASLAKGMTCDKVRPQSLVFYAPLVRDLIDAKGGLTITNNNTATVANHPRVYA